MGVRQAQAPTPSLLIRSLVKDPFVTRTAPRLRRGLAFVVPVIVALSVITATPALAVAPSAVAADGATLPLLVVTPTASTLMASTTVGASDQVLDPAVTAFTLDASADGTAEAHTTIGAATSDPAATLNRISLTMANVDAPDTGAVSATLPDGTVWGTGAGQTPTLAVDAATPPQLRWAFAAPGTYSITLSAEAQLSGAGGAPSTTGGTVPVVYRFEVSPHESSDGHTDAVASTSTQDAQARALIEGGVTEKQDASVVLASSSGSAKTGDPVTLTATVTPADAAGAVEFIEGETVLGRVPVDASTGLVSYTVANVTEGTHRYIAQFVPVDLDAYTTASSAPVTVTAHGDLRVLSSGDIRLEPHYEGLSADGKSFSSFRLGATDWTGYQFGDDTTKLVWSSAEDTVIHLTDRERDATSGAWSTALSGSWEIGDYVQGSDARLLLGLNARGAEGVYDNTSAVHQTDTTPSHTLMAVTGPDGARFTASGFGAAVEDPPGSENWVSTTTTLWDSNLLGAGGKTQTILDGLSYGNLNEWGSSRMGWTFTIAGQYCVTVKTVVETGARPVPRAGQATYTFVVGDEIDPATVSPCAQVPLVDDGSGGDPADKPTVLQKGHLDMRAVLNDTKDGITLGVKPAAFYDTKDVVLAGAYGPALVGDPDQYLNPTLIGPAGTRYWWYEQGGSDGDHLWPGLSTEGWKAADIAPGANIDFTLNGVVAPAADARVIVFDNSEDSSGFRPSEIWFDSTRLPMTRTSQIGAHQHMNWAFTAEGRYCLNFSAKTQLASGAWASDSGMLTVWIGDPAKAGDVVPCDRDTTPPQSDLAPLSVTPTNTATVAEQGGADLTTYLTDGRVDTVTRRQASATAPVEYVDPEDVVYTTAEVVDGHRTGVVTDTGLNTDRIAPADLTGPLTLSLGQVQGPGTVALTSGLPGTADVLDSASDKRDAVLPAQTNNHVKQWRFSKPGIYCVPVTWTATKAGAFEPVAVTKVLTFAVGIADYTGITSCSRGQKPTEAGSGGDPGTDDSAWNVPNRSTTDSGATILNNGHIDVASVLDGGVFDTKVKDTTSAATTEPVWRDPAQTVLQLLPAAKTTVPDNTTYAFLGTAGSPIWQVTETQQTELGLLWPGWSTESIPVDATRTSVTWALDKTQGPGEFALSKGGQTLGSVNVLFNTRDGITAADSFEIPKNSHVHGNWAFSAEGTYCLAFTRSTTLANGTKATDDFTLAVAVGKVDVKKVDPSKCFSDPGKPDTQDITPVPASQLTDTALGGVQVLGSQAGVNPGQLVTVQVGASRAGQWVSVWVHDQPTWLGWAQVSPAGTVQVRLPSDAAVGGHRVVVKSREGDLIGWDSLTVVKAPDSGGGTGTPGGGSGGPAVCTAGDTTIISSGHLDYSAQVVNGKVESYIGDNSSGKKVFSEPSKTVLWLKPSSRVALPGGYGQVGAEGSNVFMVPQTQNMDLIWLGWSTETLNASKVSSPVTWALTGVDGPGSVKVFLNGQFGDFGQMVFDGTGSYDIRTGVHAHANWAFSKEGIYKLHFTQSANLTGGGPSSDSEVVTIAVGGADPVSAVPGGKHCVNGTTPGSGTGAGAVDSAPQNGGVQAPVSQGAAQCTSTGVTVISTGHLDWNTQVIGGKLESLIGDDSTGSRLYRDPASTVLWLKPASRVTLPAGFSQVGPAGSAQWQVPQTQNYDLIWLGWSTELLNAGNASSPVTWSLTQVDGPGSVKVYTVGSFGNLQEMVFDGTSSHTIPLGLHAHANWAFSAQGVYQLHFTESATLANGQRSSDSEVLTVAVGDVNPNTALTKGPGCGVISNALLTGNTSLDAATQAAAQAQADAALVQAGLLPGGSSTDTHAVDPITALAQGNSVPLLLSILGVLLLLGGAGVGVLWWRRRRSEGITSPAPTGS